MLKQMMPTKSELNISLFMMLKQMMPTINVAKDCLEIFNL